MVSHLVRGGAEDAERRGDAHRDEFRRNLIESPNMRSHRMDDAVDIELAGR